MNPLKCVINNYFVLDWLTNFVHLLIPTIDVIFFSQFILLIKSNNHLFADLIELQISPNLIVIMTGFLVISTK